MVLFETQIIILSSTGLENRKMLLLKTLVWSVSGCMNVELGPKREGSFWKNFSKESREELSSFDRAHAFRGLLRDILKNDVGKNRKSKIMIITCSPDNEEYEM